MKPKSREDPSRMTHVSAEKISRIPAPTDFSCSINPTANYQCEESSPSNSNDSITHRAMTPLRCIRLRFCESLQRRLYLRSHKQREEILAFTPQTRFHRFKKAAAHIFLNR